MNITDIKPSNPFRPVILESPYAGNLEQNLRYARAAMRDCILRGEAPFALHLLYTQENVLDDADSERRSVPVEIRNLEGWAK